MVEPTETLDASSAGLATTSAGPATTSGGLATTSGGLATTSGGLATTAPARASVPGADAEYPVADWDRYVFIRRLGAGGMGAVYEARDMRLERLVALKFIRGGDPRLAMRLVQEARAQARIDHPNVCKVFEVGEVGGRAYIAMELVAGLPLGGLAAHLSLHEKVQVIRDVALALHEAHKLGILHRDVKPANILVETMEDGRQRPIVMDFGIAREEGVERGLTETGALLGTPAYMSPEQARGGGRLLDRRSDVYSLGATLYELLAGGPPFDGDSVMTVVLAVLNEEPRRLRARAPHVPEDLETIVAKCLSKDPGQRYDSAKALADDLDHYIAGEPILGRRESSFRRVLRTARKHRALVAMGVLALAAATVAGGLAWRARRIAAEQAVALEAEARSGRELGQDVKEMEWFLRAAHLLPLHDVTRERDVVRERMKTIATQTPASRTGAALLDYAVGRGHLALREDTAAHERLTRAARAGLDTPELHYALGLVLGRLYQREMTEARRGGAPSWVERRTGEIEAAYLKPALAAMDRCRAVRLEAPSYLDGLVAFYHKDYDAALRLAEQAHAEAPWLYEALQLEADIHLTRGIEHKDRGENEEAGRDLDAAARLFDAAAEIGRSDSALYQGSAEAHIRRMEMNIAAEGTSADDYAVAIDRCQKAAVARPDSSAPFTELAYAHHFRWARLSSKGRAEDAHAALTKELAAAQKALAIGGGDFATYERLSGARQSQALYEIGHGLDPSRSIEDALANAHRAIERSPSHPWGHAALAASHFYRGLLRMKTGQDPMADFATTIAECRAATEADRGYVIGYANVLDVLVHSAWWSVEHGVDPTLVTADAAFAFAACLQANPRHSECYENAGGIDAWLGAYRVLVGVDAGEPLSRAQENLEKAAGLLKNLENRQRLAHVHLLRAKDALRRGDAPADEIAALGRTIAECYELGAADPLCTLLDAQRELLLSEVEARQHRARLPALERAGALAALAVARNERDADAYQVLAASELRLAELASAPRDQAKHRIAGLSACKRGLALNHNHPRLLVVQAALLLGQAQAASGSEREAQGKAARDSFRRAFELNPLLRRGSGTRPQEAERLAGPE